MPLTCDKLTNLEDDKDDYNGQDAQSTWLGRSAVSLILSGSSTAESGDATGASQPPKLGRKGTWGR